MLERELSYRLPFERLMRLSRSMNRKAYPWSLILCWVLPIFFAVGVASLIVFDDAVESWQHSLGLPRFSAFGLLLAAYFAAFWAVRRFGLRQMKARADYGSLIRFSSDAEGVKFLTDENYYAVKWAGMHQLLREKDGVVLSSGMLFFLIPDTAFADLNERNGFVREVYDRLGEDAKARSEKFVRSMLGATVDAAAA